MLMKKEYFTSVSVLKNSPKRYLKCVNIISAAKSMYMCEKG